MRHVHRAWRNPALPLLQFAPMAVAQGLEPGLEPGLEAGPDVGVVWEAADHKHAFTITREFDARSPTTREVSPDPFFVAQVSWLDGSHRRRIGWKFTTFGGAVRLCSIYTRVFRRQVAYHEAGHAVTAWLLGFSGVWIDMEDSAYRAVTRHDLLPSMLAVADAASARQGASLGGGAGPDGSLGGAGPGSGRDALDRYLYEELMFTVAGMVAEVKIAGYPAGYVEVDVAGRTSIAWDAVRVARIEAGLPICGHKDCEIPLDAVVDAECIAEVIQRAEDEVFAMLQANWPIVRRVVNALCRRDRITSIEFDALITGKRNRLKRKPAPARHEDTSRGLASATAASGKHGPSIPEPSMPEPMLVGDAS
jgi:hypothetical protein